MIIQTQRDTATLYERITKIEQRLYARRHLVMQRSSALMQNSRRRMRYSLTSPVMLALAAGAGFIAQRWVKRTFSRSPEDIELRRQKRLARHEKKLAKARRQRKTGDKSGILGSGLKIAAILRTIIAALPSSWVNSLPSIARAKVEAEQAASPMSATTHARRYPSAGTQFR